MPFLSNLEGEFIRGTDNFKLTAHLSYRYFYNYGQSYLSFLVPRGFITNFANIPKCMRWYIDTDDPLIRDGAVVHDYNYTTMKYSRKLCDEILRTACMELGSSKFKAYIIYLGVRIGGAACYKDTSNPLNNICANRK
jgi:hypothetical protein